MNNSLYTADAQELVLRSRFVTFCWLKFNTPKSAALRAALDVPSTSGLASLVWPLLPDRLKDKPEVGPYTPPSDLSKAEWLGGGTALSSQGLGAVLEALEDLVSEFKEELTFSYLITAEQILYAILESLILDEDVEMPVATRVGIDRILQSYTLSEHTCLLPDTHLPREIAVTCDNIGASKDVAYLLYQVHVEQRSPDSVAAELGVTVRAAKDMLNRATLTYGKRALYRQGPYA